MKSLHIDNSNFNKELLDYDFLFDWTKNQKYLQFLAEMH